MKNLGRTAALATIILLIATLAPATAGGRHDDGALRTVVGGLDGPRGLDALGHGKTLITEIDGTFSLVIERRGKAPRVIELGSLPGGFSPAIAAGKHGKIYILTGGGPPDGPPAEGAATLYQWRYGYDQPKPVFDVAAYQTGDPDLDDLEGLPTTSNPFGLAALRDGSVLIADAEGNDLIRWWPNGHAVTVARLKPRLVDVPPELGLPFEETEAEAVATSITVGPDGYWYVGELRGFPATPGTSQIWRIKPGSVGAVCDPEKPWRGRCTRYADGLTSIVDLGASRHSVYAVSLSKMSWLAAESEEPIPGAEIGALYRLTKHHHKVWIKELAKGKLTLPGGVDVADHIYLTGPVFPPDGKLMKIK
ncbi:MAG TPA: ScyD/ScyE family protein [Nocardioides sp.]|nr:ScyD/ScyE family protein [Nocardioides sp.]